jgi:DNA-binding NarL/FixJ family response regulator
MAGAEEDRIRVAVVDDHDVVRAGLAGLLSSTSDTCLVGEANSVAGAAELLRTIVADVLVLDVYLPDGSGVTVCRNWKRVQPHTQVMMLSAWEDDAVLFAALEAGASGYLLKSGRGRTIVDAIRTVADGGTVLDAAVATRVYRQNMTSFAAEPDPWEHLSSRQRHILQLLAEGLTNREIATQLFLSETTVKYHVRNILAALGVAHRAAAAAYWTRRGPDTDC